MESTIGERVGAKVAVPLVAPLALAVITSGTMARPEYAKVTVSVELVSSPGACEVVMVVAPLLSALLSVIGLAYGPVIGCSSQSKAVTVNAVAANAVPAAPGGRSEIASACGIPASVTLNWLL